MGFCEYEKLASFLKDFIVIEGVPGVKRSTDLRVKFEEFELVAVGGEPLGRMFAVRPGLVDEVARGFEFSGDDEVVEGFIHWFGPVIEFLEGRRRVRRTNAPRKLGKFRCRCWRLGEVRA